MKKPIDSLTKYKRIYSGELIIIAIIGLVLSVLFFANVIKVADWKKWLFTIITFIGGFWVWIDFVWTIKSPKKRKKNCLLDKILLLPNASILIILDLISLIKLAQDPNWVGFGNSNFFGMLIGSALLYISVVYIFEGIYHYFVIHPMAYEMIEEENKELELENKKQENIASVDTKGK